jgi:Ser/Thr protein kinase RdoA (MazF antagonist)
MTDAAVVGRILREYHLRGLAPEGVRRVAGSMRGTQVSYQVTPGNAPSLVIRAFRADAPVPAQFSGSAAETMTHWVTGRAGTLACLAAAGYPAPRPVASRTGELVGVTGPWLTWATSYVEGPALTPTLEQLRLLGGALGRLHRSGFDKTSWRPAGPGSPGDPTGRQSGSLPASPAGGQRERAPGEPAGPGPAAGSGGAAAWAGEAAAPGAQPGLAAWHPAAAVAGTLRRLGAVTALLPGDWRDMHTAFVSCAEAVRRTAPELPEALVHGDAWPGNAVQPGTGQPGARRPGAGPVTLIDWDAGGLGLPVLDLGHALAECHLNSGLPPDKPEAWLGRADPHRIAALVSGYREARELTAAERGLLPEAVRFGAAFAGAIHFEAALTGGASGPAMDARLARLRNRLEISAEVARLALRHLS